MITAGSRNISWEAKSTVKLCPGPQNLCWFNCEFALLSLFMILQATYVYDRRTWKLLIRTASKAKGCSCIAYNTYIDLMLMLCTLGWGVYTVLFAVYTMHFLFHHNPDSHCSCSPSPPPYPQGSCWGCVEDWRLTQRRICTNASPRHALAGQAD